MRIKILTYLRTHITPIILILMICSTVFIMRINVIFVLCDTINICSSLQTEKMACSLNRIALLTAYSTGKTGGI